MTERVVVKSDVLPDLDDLLQCPVCYEIPSGQIFQCNEGHHVCGTCKARLDVCPVCRALFFGTRNYALEELIANVKRFKAFKLAGKITTGSASGESSPPAEVQEEFSPVDNNVPEETEENTETSSTRSAIRAPAACRGLFRCLCCKNGNIERLPSARLLNHLRYFHSPELIEGKSDENGEYIQAWQFATVPGRLVTAVRVSAMGIFFFIIEINNDSVYAWLSMAAGPYVALEFSYTVTISGNDREAIFSDNVWSVKSCEGSLKKRGHCLAVIGTNARALIAPASISGKLAIRRTPPDQMVTRPPPRAVVRVAERGRECTHSLAHDLEPFLQDLQNDVERLSRAFATLGREANALAHSERGLRNTLENRRTNADDSEDNTHIIQPQPVTNDQMNNNVVNADGAQLSRSARRRMRARLREVLNASQAPSNTNSNLIEPTIRPPALQNIISNPVRHTVDLAIVEPVAVPAPTPFQPISGSSNTYSQNETRTSKKKRRHRR